MRPSLVLSVAAVSLTALLGVAATAHVAAGARAADARTAEVRRIRAHFDSVLAELPTRDLTGLTAAQRARRSALVATLRAYRDRGEFPHNYDFPGRAVPYFVDRETGTLCAVAHLLAASGRRDIVDRVARADNNVWVPALGGDTAFAAWLDTSGLTLAEAARIQVPYMNPDASPTSLTGLTRNPAYAAGSILTIGSAVTATLVNGLSNGSGAGRSRSVLGVTAGAAALGWGAASLTVRDASPVLGATNVAVGAASAWIAARGMRRHHRVVVVERERRAALARQAVVTPLLPVGKSGGAGVAVTLPF
jgi:hypothetical protein